MSQGLFSIGGIASGLDTQTLIAQLLQLERQPVVRLQNQQAALRKVDEAWGQVATRLSALRTSIDAIARPDRFSSMIAVTSSDPAIAAVTTGTGERTGSLTFSVSQLAQAHQVASGAFTAPDEPLDAGAVTVAVGGTSVTVELDGAKTLTDLAAELNARKGGFTASVVPVGDGQHRLVLAGSATGEANALTVTSDLAQLQPGQRSELQSAQDAKVQLGTGADAISLARASNSITDLVPGAVITLQKVSEQPITVTSSQDAEAAVTAVRGYVDALNAAITSLAELTKADPAAGKAGPLQGEAAARRLLDQLRGAAVAPAGGAGSLTTAFQVGIAVDRQGAVTLDEAQLRNALALDFGAVGQLFGRTGTATDAAASAITGTPATKPGEHLVVVSRAATLARATGDALPPDGPIEAKTLRITSGGSTATVMVDGAVTSAEQLQAAIADALRTAKITSLSVQLDGDNRLVLEDSRFGTPGAFRVEALDADGAVDPTDTAFGLAGSHTGLDVAGTIGGVEAKGSGRTLTGQSGASAGLSLTYRGDVPDGGATLTVTFARGLAGNLADVLGAAEGVTGSLARARQSITSRIEIFQSRIDSFDQRLDSRERTLRQQFTAMEVALAALNAQGSWLTSQIGSLSAYNAQR